MWVCSAFQIKIRVEVAEIVQYIYELSFPVFAMVDCVLSQAGHDAQMNNGNTTKLLLKNKTRNFKYNMVIVNGINGQTNATKTLRAFKFNNQIKLKSHTP